MSDMRGIEVDLNNLRPVRIELSPRKICAELKQHIAVKSSMIAGSSADHTGHTDSVGIVVRHKVLAPRGVSHWRLQPLGGGDHLVVRTGTSGAGINRDRLAAVENGRDFVEVGVVQGRCRSRSPFLTRYKDHPRSLRQLSSLGTKQGGLDSCVLKRGKNLVSLSEIERSLA